MTTRTIDQTLQIPARYLIFLATAAGIVRIETRDITWHAGGNRVDGSTGRVIGYIPGHLVAVDTAGLTWKIDEWQPYTWAQELGPNGWEPVDEPPASWLATIGTPHDLISPTAELAVSTSSKALREDRFVTEPPREIPIRKRPPGAAARLMFESLKMAIEDLPQGDDERWELIQDIYHYGLTNGGRSEHDRHLGYLVALRRTVRDDHAEGILTALRHIDGVIGVEPVPADPQSACVRQQERLRWYEMLMATFRDG